MRAKVILLNAKQATVLRGHPWIFPKAISRTTGKLVTGELVDIYNEDNEFIGVGAYNEHSLYRVRILALVNEEINTDTYQSIITTRLLQAYQVRQSLNLPNTETSAYRLFNSEADGLSGLTIDRFNNFCVVSSTAYWVEVNKGMIIESIKDLLTQDEIIWLAQLKSLAQDGWKNEESNSTHHSTEVLEVGVKFQVEFAHAQKTGLFLDQRENHKRIADLAKGTRVLDLYTYTLLKLEQSRLLL